MTEEIRFQRWLGVAHTGLTSVDGPTAAFADSTVSEPPNPFPIVV